MDVIKYFFLVLILTFLLACDKNTDKKIDVSKITSNAELIRFDQRFYTSAPEDLDQLKSEFRYLFPEPNPDSLWIAKMKDEDELFLYKSVQEVFGDFQKEKAISLLNKVFGDWQKGPEPNDPEAFIQEQSKAHQQRDTLSLRWTVETGMEQRRR